MSEYLIDSNGLKVEFHYEDAEASETLLFLPGSYANKSAWKGITKALKIPCKKVFTSLRGYGNTEETRSVNDYNIDHQLEIIRTISKKLNSDFHIVGHSMGGLVGFAAVFSGEFPIKSIITFEGNPPWVLDTTKYKETLNKTLKMATYFEKAVIEDKNDSAKIIIDFYGGDGTFSSFPGKVQDFCRSNAHVNLLDWLPIIRSDPPKFERSLFKKSLNELPVKLVVGQNANFLIKDINNELCLLFKKHVEQEIKGAGHFLISTHPKDCANAIDEFIISQRTENDCRLEE